MQGNVTLHVMGTASLTSQNVSLSGSTIILTGIPFTLCFILLICYFTFNKGASEMFSTQFTFVTDGSVLEIDGTGGYAQTGSLFFLSNNSSISILGTGYLGLYLEKYLNIKHPTLQSTQYVIIICYNFSLLLFFHPHLSLLSYNSFDCNPFFFYFFFFFF
jgi:hypothetical protein